MQLKWVFETRFLKGDFLISLTTTQQETVRLQSYIQASQNKVHQPINLNSTKLRMIRRSILIQDKEKHRIITLQLPKSQNKFQLNPPFQSQQLLQSQECLSLKTHLKMRRLQRFLLSPIEQTWTIQLRLKIHELPSTAEFRNKITPRRLERWLSIEGHFRLTALQIEIHSLLFLMFRRPWKQWKSNSQKWMNFSSDVQSQAQSLKWNFAEWKIQTQSLF